MKESMEYKIENNNVICYCNGNVIGTLTMINEGNTYNISKVYVNESYRGIGIASKMMEMALCYIHENHKEVKATCSYAKKYLEKKGNSV